MTWIYELFQNRAQSCFQPAFDLCSMSGSTVPAVFLRIDVVTIGSLMKGVPKWTWWLGEWTHSPPFQQCLMVDLPAKGDLQPTKCYICSMFFSLEGTLTAALQRI